MRSATDTTVLIEQDGVENRVSIDRVTKMPRGPGDTVTPATRTESDAEVATPSAEYVVDRIFGHRTARGGVEYKVRWYGCTAGKTPTSPPMGFRSRPSTYIGVRSKDGQARTRSVCPAGVARTGEYGEDIFCGPPCSTVNSWEIDGSALRVRVHPIHPRYGADRISDVKA